jgi:N-alpha-acetyltransferase 15/16, NatA auxiliary subunit
LESLIKLYLKNNQKAKALESVNELIKINPYNAEYYKLVFQAKGLDVENEPEESVLAMMAEYQELAKKSNTADRVALDLLKAGPVFKDRLAKYIRPLVIKGVSSLINELRTLYLNAEKTKILGEVLLAMSESMEKEMVLNPEDEKECDPTVQMWLYCFLS